LVNYLLDTNACIALLNGRPEQVRRRLERAQAENAAVLVPSVVVFELWHGVAKSARREANAEALEAFLAGPLDIVLFDAEDARVAGWIREKLVLDGTPIGAYDILIAGQAMRLGATLVTTNRREFARMAGLSWEDWSVATGP
jgi:tRNA(fMet)-specific endonuclease VapC